MYTPCSYEKEGETMNKLSKIVSKIEEYVLSYSVIIMAIMLITNVICRKVFNRSITFSEEVGQALLIIVSFFGIGYCAKQARHITMSVLFDLASDKVKKIFMYFILLLSAIALFYFSYLGFQYVLKVHELGRVTPALRIPIYMIYIVVPLGFLLGAIEYLRSFIINIRKKEIYLSSEKILADEDLTVAFQDPADQVSVEVTSGKEG